MWVPSFSSRSRFTIVQSECFTDLIVQRVCPKYKVNASPFTPYFDKTRQKSKSEKNSQELWLGITAHRCEGIWLRSCCVLRSKDSSLPGCFQMNWMCIWKRTHSAAAGLNVSCIPTCVVPDLRIDTSDYSEELLGLKWSTSLAFSHLQEPNILPDRS